MGLSLRKKTSIFWRGRQGHSFQLLAAYLDDVLAYVAAHEKDAVTSSFWGAGHADMVGDIRGMASDLDNLTSHFWHCDDEILLGILNCLTCKILHGLIVAFLHIDCMLCVHVVMVHTAKENMQQPINASGPQALLGWIQKSLLHAQALCNKVLLNLSGIPCFFV